MNYFLSLDVGSISVNTIVLNESEEILENRYTYCHGKPFNVVRSVIAEILDTYRSHNLQKLVFTGSGGQKMADLLGGQFVNEIIAQSTAVIKYYPEGRTIIEMGGEDSKLIFLENDSKSSHTQLSDFVMNSLCAAGTGSFLDQQANRIGVAIENEFGALALKSENPPRIAGRCSVFAKSDMIHLQQVATPLHDIVAGLCFAVARNFKSTLGRGKDLQKPVIFQGGVAANAGMVRAFREIYKLQDGELIIPEHYASMGALGAIHHAIANPGSQDLSFKGLSSLDDYLNDTNHTEAYHTPLEESKATYDKAIKLNNQNGHKTKVSLGIDVGSLSTNVVLIDKDNQVVARRYLPTASKPLHAIQRGLKEVFEEVGEHVEVTSVGTTGSGRYLTGDFVGADIIQNEITAQATAAIAHDPEVDTIFEIGGQDSKYISIRNGVIVDFEMNKVCAAGTGSFLEEQAEKLNIQIKKEFGEKALSSKTPVKLGNRCTVFMESDLNAHQQRGSRTEDLIGGLAYSIVENYIQKVVGVKPIGNKIFFQGGVTNNKSVVAAFEKVTGKPITIPPHYDVTGAIGAAILARNAINGHKTRFKGFQVSEIPFTVDRFTCKKCSNYCEIQKVKLAGEKKPLYYGGRCDRWEVQERKGKGEGIPDYFEERLEFLMGDYREEKADERITIGIPRSLMLFYHQFPFWRTFFKEMGFRLVISDPSDQPIIKKSLELMVSETCFPVELVHGHVNNLLEKKVDYVFIPFVVNTKGEKDNPTNNCNCPWVQTYPFMLKSAFKDPAIREKFLIPTLHFRYFDRGLKKELSGFMQEKFNLNRKNILKAIDKADEVQRAFEDKIKQRGREVLTSLGRGQKGMVILGRPYNTGDQMLNLRLVKKLINLNTVPIPIDYLPLEEENIFEDYKMMYWPNGQRILAASRLVKKYDNLYAVYMGNFRCGPDTFIKHYVDEEMKGKPFLHLEVDEHSADAGMVTRLEAFLDSLNGYQKEKVDRKPVQRKKVDPAERIRGRTLYFPYARDTVHALAAASRYCGVDAEVLPMPNEKDLEIAKKLTNGQECFPFICTTGSFVRKITEPGADPGKMAFFMPDHNGPCRFGDYNKLHRIIFNRLGYDNVEIVTPSNDNGYAELAPGKSGKFRINAWKGIVATDMLKKLLQEKRPYEIEKGQSQRTYDHWLKEVIRSVETGSKDLPNVLERAGKAFQAIPFSNGVRKPLIAVLGETFMRDNPFASGFIVEKLEALGAETIMSPFAEWITYSTYRYDRDSKWKGDIKGIFKARIQKVAQLVTAGKLHGAVKDFVEMEREIELKDMIRDSAPYVHKDYDGEPVVAIGSASGLHKTGISGVVYIMPFTCMPGTLVASVANDFRKDHGNIPWETIAYEGQEDVGIETRLQAFMHQVNEYAKTNKKSQKKPVFAENNGQ